MATVKDITNITTLDIYEVTEEQYEALLQSSEFDPDAIYLTPNSGGGGSGTVTSVEVANATDGGMSISGSPVTTSGTISIGHINVLTSSQATQAVYPITIDKNGHIASFGTAVSIPTKTSDLNNDSGYITSSDIPEIAYKGTMTLSGTTATLSGIAVNKIVSTIQNIGGTGKNIVYVYNNSGNRELYYLTDFDYESGEYNFTFTCYSVRKLKSVYTTSYSATSTSTSMTGTYSEVAILDLGNTSTTAAAGNHVHGNITNAGDITTTATIASGDRLVINDESASKINNSSITFGTSTTTFLANNGTWQTPASSTITIRRWS